MNGVLDSSSTSGASSTAAAAATSAATSGAAPLWRRLLLGRETDAAWVRPALLGLLALSTLLYLWGLGRSGWANSYYAAAVEAGTKSWKAFVFGSFDAGNYITVDKTPASLWAMVLSARLFGLSSWSLLAPQALMGVATVGFTYASVRRWWGPAGGLLAGGVVALTPVAAMMFRYNNPDALLTLVLVVAAYAMLRAVEDGRTRWLVLAGGLVGVGYLTKMLQAFVVLPVFALAYLVAGPPRIGPSYLAVAGRAGGGGGLGGLVGGSGRAVAGVVATPHRGFDDQQHPAAHLWLQRVGAAHGQRDGCRGPGRGSDVLGFHRSPASVHPRDGGRGLVALADGPRGPGGRRRPRGRGVARAL